MRLLNLKTISFLLFICVIVYVLNTTVTETSNEKYTIKQEIISSTEESLPTFEFEDIKIFGEFSENEVF